MRWRIAEGQVRDMDLARFHDGIRAGVGGDRLMQQRINACSRDHRLLNLTELQCDLDQWVDDTCNVAEKAYKIPTSTPEKLRCPKQKITTTSSTEFKKSSAGRNNQAFALNSSSLAR